MRTTAKHMNVRVKTDRWKMFKAVMDKVLRTTYVGAEKIEGMQRYINTRLRDAIYSLNDSSSSEIRKFDPLLEPIVITGSAPVQNRTRSFEDILASARNLQENKFNNGIRYLGVQNFLSAAAQFCEDEARGGMLNIVSIGAGINGYVEKNIVAKYHERFGDRPAHLNLWLVDPKNRGDSTQDFKYVDDLIRECPSIVGNCVLFVLCPDPDAHNDGYDLESVRKLKPRAVLAEYDASGESGSEDFVRFLDGSHGEEFNKKHGIGNYPIKEILLEVKWMGLDVKLVKVKKTN